MLADTPGFITWPHDGWLWNCGYVAHVSVRADLQVVLQALPEVLARHNIVITPDNIETTPHGNIVIVAVVQVDNGSFGMTSGRCAWCRSSPN